MDGEYVDDGWLMWQFIKSTDQHKEYELFKSALVEVEFDLHR